MPVAGRRAEVHVRRDRMLRQVRVHQLEDCEPENLRQRGTMTVCLYDCGSICRAGLVSGQCKALRTWRTAASRPSADRSPFSRLDMMASSWRLHLVTPATSHVVSLASGPLCLALALSVFVCDSAPSSPDEFVPYAVSLECSSDVCEAPRCDSRAAYAPSCSIRKRPSTALPRAVFCSWEVFLYVTYTSQ